MQPECVLHDVVVSVDPLMRHGPLLGARLDEEVDVRDEVHQVVEHVTGGVLEPFGESRDQVGLDQVHFLIHDSVMKMVIFERGEKCFRK